MSDAIANETKIVANGGSAQRLLELLLSSDCNDIGARSAVRYLRSMNLWSFEEGSLYAQALEHLFANSQNVRITPEEYVAKTSAFALEAWGHTFPVVCTTPSEPKEAKAPKAKKTTKPKEKGEGESGSRKFKSLNEHLDTSGASERLKRVIDIQRNG